MSRTKPSGVTSESAGRSNEVCRACLSSGTYEERLVSLPLTFSRRVVIFENVPAFICRQCGESELSAETAKLIDELGRGSDPPSRTADVPVYDFSDNA